MPARDRVDCVDSPYVIRCSSTPAGRCEFPVWLKIDCQSRDAIASDVGIVNSVADKCNLLAHMSANQVPCHERSAGMIHRSYLLQNVAKRIYCILH